MTPRSWSGWSSSRDLRLRYRHIEKQRPVRKPKAGVGMETWLPQFAVAVVTFVTGLVAYLATRTRPAPHSGATGTHGSAPTLLNGYASVLHDALEKWERLNGEYQTLMLENQDLKARVADCEATRRLAAQARPRRHQPVPPADPPFPPFVHE